MNRTLLLIAVLAALWPTCLHAQPFTQKEQAEVDRLVAETLAKSKVPSVSVAVVRGGEIAFVKAYGSAQLSPERGATPAARYDIGSVSKQFTATLVLILVDEGRLSLDDTVGRYLPGLVGGDRVTLRQLLSQTSGYINYWRVDYLPPAMRQDVAPQTIVDRWGREPLAFDPGTQWQYSNTNYVLAARIVEIIEGRPLAEVLEARIFKPLGMSSAKVGPAPPFEATDAAGYTRVLFGPTRPAERVPAGWTFGAGGLSMTAKDLALWDLAMLDRRLLSSAGYLGQQTEVRLADGAGAHYGLGVYVGRAGGRRVISHDGASMGFLTQNRVYPDDRSAIVVTVNADFGSAQYEIAEALERMVLGPVAEAPASPTVAAAPEPPPKPVNAATTSLARRILDDLAVGRLDASLFTSDGASYFTPERRADLQASLAQLGPPNRFELMRWEPWAGYDASIHELGWADRKLVLIMFRTADGRVEEYYLFSPD
ncbi:MAG TPA: serine hydrolase domain-containing protein [Caulobacter sp.]|nr:serine hydrolase domain-containing protein [Caulobacter sp.]